MLYDQNPDPKQDENSSSGDSFSFLKETIKPKPVSREKIFMQLLRMAIYGVIIGMSVSYTHLLSSVLPPSNEAHEILHEPVWQLRKS